MGPTRSMRLPQALDEWFEERLERHAERSPSAILVQLVHGGLRLREGYMEIHRRVLEQHISSGATETYAAYVQCLTDTFGPEYVLHLTEWIAAERVARPATSAKNGKARV
jgi:predicted metal-dependent phosphoesterase TrpH